MIKTTLRKALRTFFVLALSFIAGKTFAQNPSANISEPIHVEDKMYIIGAITADSSGYYLTKIDRKTYDIYIEKMDKNHKSLYNKKPDLKEDDFFLWRMFNTKNTIQSILIKNIKQSKKVEIYTVIFNKSTGEYGQPILLTTLDNMVYKDTYYAGGGYMGGPLDMVPPGFRSDGNDIDVEIACTDNSQHMYLYVNPYQKNTEKFRFTVSVFNEQGKNEWKREITLPYIFAQYYGIGMQLDKSGQNFVLGSKIYKQSKGVGEKIQFDETVKDEKKDLHPNYDIQILQFNANSNDHTYTISPRDNFIDTLDFAFDNHNNMYLCGKYSLDNEYETMDGLIYAKVNLSTNKMELEVQDNIPANATDSTTDDVVRSIKKTYLFRGKFKIKHIFPQDDGTVMLCFEYDFKELHSNSTMNNSGMVTSTNYFYIYYNYDFLAIRLKADGSIDHVTDIPRLAKSTDDGVVGNCVFQQGNKFNVIYLDDPDNMHIKIPTKISRWTGGNYDLVMATVYPNGYFGKQVLLNKKKEKVDETVKFDASVLSGEGTSAQSAILFMMHFGLFKGYTVRICEVTGL